MVTTTTPIKAEARDLDFYYSNGMKALKSISMPLYEKKITALIGPSGCGKSTFLRCFNRMHDLYPGNKYDGEIIIQTILTYSQLALTQSKCVCVLAWCSKNPIHSQNRSTKTSLTVYVCAVKAINAWWMIKLKRR